MATTKKEDDKYAALLYSIPAILATLVFSLYHFSQLKKHYLAGINARRVFDIGAQGAELVASGFFGLACYMMGVWLYSLTPLSLVLTLPLGLYLLNWIGMAQAYVFLGVVVDYDQGLVFFPPNAESLDIVERLMVIPMLKQMTSMDSVPLASIERITRQAGKRVLLHGDFGSRHITFTDKLKRDECLHLLMAGNSRRGALMQELE
jgi:hypothetical protein